MFARIAKRYDLLNRIITFGQDARWRREAIRRLELSASDRVLDLGTGTGELAFEALRQVSRIHAVGADFTPEMMRVGRAHRNGHAVDWVIADAHALPFMDATFDGVVSGFLLRNVVNLKQTLKEQYRILKPDGRMVCLETTPPAEGLFKPVLTFYLQVLIPAWGRLISGENEAYHYLPDTTQSFIPANELTHLIEAAGFHLVRVVTRMLGTIAIHWGHKPPP